MAHKSTRSRPHAEFRHRSQIPMPAVAEVEQRLLDVLSPSLRAPRQLERRDLRQPHRLIRMRQRLLTLPIIVDVHVYFPPIAHESIHTQEVMNTHPALGGRQGVSAGIALRQRLQQGPSLLEVGRIKALGEPPVDWFQEVIGFLAFALLLPESSETSSDS